MQSVLSRNWTRIAVSLSCDDNHYTTGTYDMMMMMMMTVCVCVFSDGEPSNEFFLLQVKYISKDVLFVSAVLWVGWLVGWVVGFYDISAIVAYLMPNSVYIYKLNTYS